VRALDPMTDRLFLNHDAVTGAISGVDPNRLDPEVLATRHPGDGLMAAIQRKCTWCQMGDQEAVRTCTSIGCPLWIHRTGFDPFEPPPPRAREAPPVHVEVSCAGHLHACARQRGSYARADLPTLPATHDRGRTTIGRQVRATDRAVARR
jgi:hypothetical protein